jgi:hypothetical protein
VYLQDSRGHSSKSISELGGYSEFNRSRDFWKWINIGLDAGCKSSMVPCYIIFIKNMHIRYPQLLIFCTVVSMMRSRIIPIDWLLNPPTRRNWGHLYWLNSVPMLNFIHVYKFYVPHHIYIPVIFPLLMASSPKVIPNRDNVQKHPIYLFHDRWPDRTSHSNIHKGEPLQNPWWLSWSIATFTSTCINNSMYMGIW